MDSITDLIPHRPPFLLLNTLTGTANGTDGLPSVLTAEFVVDPQMPLFANIFPGHYPENPVTPGVILCEIIFQAGAALMARRLKALASENGEITGVPVITRIRDARFKRVVKPGEKLTISVNFDEQVANAYYLDGKITVDGALAVKCAFTCALI